MARKKVTLQWIANDATRRATFKKRRRGLIKKATELATLCDVRACVVVYGEGEAQPEVWPSAEEARRILTRFKAMPELDQCKKMMNQEGFLRQRIGKLQEQIHKWGRDNRERETTVLMYEVMLGRRPDLLGISIEELTSLGWMVEMRLKSIAELVEKVRGQAALLQAPPAPYPAYPYAPAGNMAPPMYHQAPEPQQDGWLDVVRSGGDLGALVYSGFTGSNNGAGTSAGASTSAGGGDMTGQFSNLGGGFSWTWGADPGPSSFPPM